MNITTINKALKNINETKKSTAIKASGKGKYYIKDEGTIAFFTIENNAITYLKFTTERMNEEIFSCLYSFNLISFDAKIIIDNKEYNLFECEKMFGFLGNNKEEILEEIERLNKHIEKIKTDNKKDNIKLKKLIENGYTDKEIKPIKEQIEHDKKRLNNKERLLKVLNEMIEEIETEEKKTMDKNNNAYKGLIALGFEVNEEVKEVKETRFTKANIYAIEFNGKEIGIYTEQVNQYGGCPVEHMYYIDYYNDEDVNDYIRNHKINNEVEQEETKEISTTHSTNLVEKKEINKEVDNKKETKESNKKVKRIAKKKYDKEDIKNFYAYEILRKYNLIPPLENKNKKEEVKTINKYNKEERAKQVVEKMGIEYKEGMTLDDLLNEGRELIEEEEQEAFEFIEQVSILPKTQQAIDKSLNLLWGIEDLINKVDKELEEEEKKATEIIDELKEINYFMIDLDDVEDKKEIRI